jgi:hypothetical protein
MANQIAIPGPEAMVRHLLGALDASKKETGE